MTGQLESSQCLPMHPLMAAGLLFADRSASTLLLVVMEWWLGHPPAPIRRYEKTFCFGEYSICILLSKYSR